MSSFYAHCLFVALYSKRSQGGLEDEPKEQTARSEVEGGVGCILLLLVDARQLFQS